MIGFHIYIYVCVCVCVCVTYALTKNYLLHFISDPASLRIPVPIYIPAIHRLWSLPCYNPTTPPSQFRVPDFVPSCPYRRAPVDLATPGRKQCHQCSIRQLRLLPNAHPFVAMDAEEQGVRPHYF